MEEERQRKEEEPLRVWLEEEEDKRVAKEKVRKEEEERLQKEKEEEARDEEERKRLEKERAEQERIAKEAEDIRLVEDADKALEGLAQTKGGREGEMEEGEIYDDQTTPPPQDALATACIISDIHAVSYPEGVSSLNQNAREGKFRYVTGFIRLRFSSSVHVKRSQLLFLLLIRLALNLLRPHLFT